MLNLNFQRANDMHLCIFRDCQVWRNVKCMMSIDVWFTPFEHNILNFSYQNFSYQIFPTKFFLPNFSYQIFPTKFFYQNLKITFAKLLVALYARCFLFLENSIIYQKYYAEVVHMLWSDKSLKVKRINVQLKIGFIVRWTIDFLYK